MTRHLWPIFAALCASCSVSGVVGSSWLTQARVDADGGTVSITPGESSTLGGSGVTIPPGALGQPATVEGAPAESLAFGDWLAAGPAVDWDPDNLMLQVPAQFTLPAQLPAGRDADDLLLLAMGPNGAELLFGTQLQYDGTLVHFSIDYLGTFQAAIGKPCSDRAGCQAGNSCVHGGCRPEGDGSRAPP